MIFKLRGPASPSHLSQLKVPGDFPFSPQLLKQPLWLWVSVVEFGSTFQRKNFVEPVADKNFRWRIYPERLSLLSRIGLKKHGFFPGTELAVNQLMGGGAP